MTSPKTTKPVRPQKNNTRSKPPEENNQKPTPQLASRGIRFGGYCVDKISIIFVSLLLVPLLKFAAGPLISHYLQTDLVAFARYTLSFLLINAIPIVTKSQTLGAMLTRTKIVTMNGTKVPLWKIFFLREILFWGLLCLPFFLNSLPVLISRLYCLLLIANGAFIFRSDRRCIHDLTAGTQVVNCE